MGTSAAAIRFPDGTILWSTYQNTSDILHSRLFMSLDEAFEAPISGASCTCDLTDQVEIAVTYGAGFWWLGEACRICMAVIRGIDPLGVCDLEEKIETHDGYPDWWPEEA